ncbi:hypothetical protein AAHE18_06G120700 [Arachis hypogaea]
MSAPNDWLQFYNQNFPSQGNPSIPVTAATPTTATATATTSPLPGMGMMVNSGSPPTSSPNLSPEGRVSKPARRRSRASRRTPTTLLTTDTTNFRAMVQQFTGGPNAPFAPTASPAAPSGLPNLLGLGFGSRPVPAVNPSTLMVSPPAGYLLQQQQHHQNLFQPQNQQFMYSGSTQGGGDNTFFQRLSNPTRPSDHDHEVLMDHEHGGRFFPSSSS